MNGFQDKVGFIWSVADEVLRDDFKRGKYPDVILPFTVLRRLDCVLAPTKEKVLRRHAELKGRGLSNLDGQLRKASGDKRNELGEDHIVELAGIAEAFKEGAHAKIFRNADFAYRKITVERPLRLNFQTSAERIDRLKDETAFQNLAKTKNKGKGVGAYGDTPLKNGGKMQKAVISTLGKIDPVIVCKSRDVFNAVLDEAFDPSQSPLIKGGSKGGVKLASPLKKAILSALSERDETADICRDAEGNPEPDPELRDYENVPYEEDVYSYFGREVKPHVPDAWINENVRDEKDGKVGKVGYEINFTRYFYQYQPPRPLEEIEADIKTLEAEIMKMLSEISG
ncbi:MAG: type I restriction-modification system subunit M N-terminal domain-containing protein [Nitrospirae bacterium]|nr:type I restriction-modification system subunit M N-terminal domain-containing protein [Nitrospirota bacterium]